MNNVKYMIPLLALILLVPGIMNDTFAQRVNDDYTISNSTLFGLIPDDNTIGPVAVVSELHKAHSDLTGIMIDHSKGNFDVAENIVFTMVLVDEENKKLVVMIDPVLLSLGLDTSTSDIQQLFNTDVNVDLSYAVFIPESHTNPSSQSQINTWISLYNDRCSVSTTSALCAALIFNLEMQNHYTLNSSGMWVAPSTSTPSSTPDPIIPTTPTTNTTQTILFSDDFEDGTLNKWTESGESDWRADTFDENRVPTDHPSTNKVAEADNCDTMCTLTIKNIVDISTSTDPKLEFWRYVDRSLDNTEYLKVEVTKNGATWVQLDKWNPENGDDDDTWHKETFDLSPYKFSNFKVRFVASMSSGSEDVGIDDVEITSQNTNSTYPIVQGGEQIIVDASYGTKTETSFGTIGIVTRNSANQVVAVSNSHVLNPGGIVDRIYQNNISNTTSTTIGTLGTSTATQGTASSDSAYVLLNNQTQFNENTIQYDGTLLTVTKLGGINEMRTGTQLKIAGDLTDSVGGLQYHNVTVRGGFDAIDGRHSYTLTNQMSGSYNSLDGDSGAPVFNDENGVTLFGMHVGATCQIQLDDERILGFIQNHMCPPGSKVYKIFSPWETISSTLNLQ